MNEIVVPLRRPAGGSPLGGSPTYSTASQSSHWDNIFPVGTLQPSPSMRDVPKLSPVAHCVHTEPLSGVIFTQDSVLAAFRKGQIKIWIRPECVENQRSNAEAILNISSRDKSSSMIAENGK